MWIYVYIWKYLMSFGQVTRDLADVDFTLDLQPKPTTFHL